MKLMKKGKRVLAYMLVAALLLATPVPVSADNVVSSDDVTQDGNQSGENGAQEKEYPIQLEIIGLTNGSVHSGDKVTFRATGGGEGNYFLCMTVDGNKAGARIMKDGELTLTAGSFDNKYEDYVLPLGLNYTVYAYHRSPSWDKYEYSAVQEFSVSYESPAEYKLVAKGANRLYTGVYMWSLHEPPILYKDGKPYKTTAEMESVYRFAIYTEQERTLVSQDGMIHDVGCYDVTVYELFKDDETGETLLATAEPVKAKIIPLEIHFDPGLLDGGKFTVTADYDGKEHGIDASQVTVNGMSEDDYSITYGYVDESDKTWTESEVPPAYVAPGTYTVNITANFKTSKLLKSSAVAKIVIRDENGEAPEQNAGISPIVREATESNGETTVSPDTDSTDNAGNVSTDTVVAEAPESSSTDTNTGTASTDSNTNGTEGFDNGTDGDVQVDTPPMGCDGQFPWLFKLRIDYVLNGGKNHRQNYRTVDKGDTLILKNPTKKGYVFKGWYSDKNYKNKVTKLVSKGGEDITLYAKWSKVKTGKGTITSLKNGKGNKAKLKFKKLKNADGYEVVYGTGKGLNKGSKTLAAKTNTVTLKNLKNKTYYVKVRAYWIDSTGKKIYGKYSAVKHTVRK